MYFDFFGFLSDVIPSVVPNAASVGPNKPLPQPGEARGRASPTLKNPPHEGLARRVSVKEYTRGTQAS